MAISNELKNKLQAGIGYPENVSYLGNKPNFTRDTFDTLSDMRDAAEAGYIDEGHLSYCKEDGKHYKYTKVGANSFNWVVFKPGGSNEGALGIYTQEGYDSLEEEDKPNDYIIADDYSSPLEKEQTTLDVLFSSIRALQAEVTRLKNSFNLGIKSATGSETASSRIIYDLEDVEEEEPLWAVQESELSSLFSLQFTTETELTPSGGGSIVIGPNNQYLEIQHGSAYLDTTNRSLNADHRILPDAKYFLYLTTSEKTISLDFTGDNNLTYNVNLNSILGDNVVSGNSYSTLVVVSKKVKDSITKEYYGDSFVWITVQDLVNNNSLFEKYLDPGTGSLSTSTIHLQQNFYLTRVSLSDTKVSKFDIYSKYQDFSDHVDAVRPSDIDTITYKAAHITIRSVNTVDELDRLIKKLQENELVYVVESSSLYIINGNAKHKLSGSGSQDGPQIDDDMTVQELIANLASQGLISLEGAQYDNNGNLEAVSNIEFSKIASMSLINESTGEEVTYSVDSNGELRGYTETPENLKFSYITVNGNKQNTVIGTVNGELTALNGVNVSDTPTDSPIAFSTNRGFIARIHGDGVAASGSDQKLKTDRVKIGSFYAPFSDATVWGCSHSFIELENTSDTDYYLDSCYLHFAGPIIGKATDGSGTTIATQATYHVPLQGKLPAGGTYLIRGAKYTDPDLPTTYISVSTYDKEWYVTRDSVDFAPLSGYNYDDNFKKLIKLDYISGASDIVYGLALTYGQPKLSYDTMIVQRSDDNVHSVKPYVIDSLNMFISEISKAKWNAAKSASALNIVKDCPGNAIIKNTFELDPAKQAFQSYSTKDSSRLRGVTAADNQIIELNNKYIQFPNSNDTYPVSKFTPKASFERKNVSTDKTQLDPEKPNMVTVSFGINQATTRCFNWISVGDYPEYVWIRLKDSEGWTRIQSYWGDEVDMSATFSRKNFDAEITYGGGNTTRIRDVVYAAPKYKNIYPGCGVYYVSHKCIIDINYPTGSTSHIFEYLVGRSNSDGTPMEGHVSNIQTFTLYPSSWKPVIYQITDQQGFHWIEYQAWAAAARKINEKIKADQEEANIIPILLNTGDMTQNGTRINEWLDYYNAGYCLFDHLEQMNLVGNNDLGNSNEKILGTGDDPGKSNPHFYNMCYCYEIPVVTSGSNVYTPIYCGNHGPVYIPSMYYFDAGNNFRIFVGNSEITGTAGIEVFDCQLQPNTDNPVDIYTGLTWKDGATNTSDVTTSYLSPYSMTIGGKNASFYIYEILYKWMSTTPSSRKGIFTCHEMPFTVVTQDNLVNSAAYADRSISVVGASTGLIGSHCNKNNFVKTGNNLSSEFKLRSKGTYWLSRLLEDRGIKYCIGGHKHTYACTWPLRENYYYNESGTIKSSLADGPMTMPESLSNDTVYFWDNGSGQVVVPTLGDDMVGSNTGTYKNLTKYPIVSSSNFNGSEILGNYSGGTDEYIKCVTKDTYSGSKPINYVIYFMLQATGFKLKSNKELPGTLQKFSQIIPQTQGSKPSTQQIYPMFAKIVLESTSKYDSGLDFQLMALKNIVPNDQTAVFNIQTTKSDSSNTKYKYCADEPEILFFDNRSGNTEELNIPYGYSNSGSYGDRCWSTESKILKLHI